MANSNLPVPQRTQAMVIPPKGVTPSQPTIIINAQPVRSSRRFAFRHPDRIEIGGGAVFPKIKSSREDLTKAVVAMGIAAALVYGAKFAFDQMKDYLTRRREQKQSAPTPPKVESIVNCVNNAGAPKQTLIPNMIVEGGFTVVGGREGSGKTLLGHQWAIELARGYGELAADGISPQNVLIIDGELDDDDYVERFGNMDIPSNITRISDCDFDNLKQLAAYVKTPWP
jgi:hypothetical protein